MVNVTIWTNCINCGKSTETGYTWFCNRCTRVKEESYRISAGLNEQFHDVIIRRDRMLRESLKEANVEPTTQDKTD